MAEQNAIPRSQVEERIQHIYRLSRLAEIWEQEDREIKKPDEALRLEKSKLKSKLQSALADCHNCARDPGLLAGLHDALKRVVYYADRLRILEPLCDCMNKERQRTYERQEADHRAKFPFGGDLTEAYTVTQAYTVRSPTASPAPSTTSSPSERDSTTSSPSERDRSQPPSAEPTDEAAEDSTDTPVSTQPTVPSPSSSPGGAVSEGASPEPDNGDGGRHHAAAAMLDSDEDGTIIAVGGMPSAASGGKVQRSKRKGIDTSLVCTIHISKRIRLDATMPIASNRDDKCDEGSSESQSDDEADPVVPARRTIVNGRPRDQRNRDEAILDPVPGGIYLAYWQKLVGQVAVIVLPRGCFGDPSFSDVGLPASLVGSLAEDTSLMDNVPECYRVCQDTRQITGWQEGYEDGGDRVEDREYPVMNFDGVEHMRKTTVAWIPGKQLRAYNRDGMASNGGLISNFAYLRRFEAQRIKTRAAAYEQQNSLDTEDDEAFSDAMELESPQPDTSSPTLQATEATEEWPETTATNCTVPGPSATLSTSRPPYTSSAVWPSREATVGHAATRVDWGPSRNLTTQGTGSVGDQPVDSRTMDLRRTATAALIQDGGQGANAGSENAGLTSSSMPYTSLMFSHVEMEQQAVATSGTAVPPEHRTASTAFPYTPQEGKTGTSPPRPATHDVTHAHKQEDETTTPPLYIDRADATAGPTPHWLQGRGTPGSPIDLEACGQPFIAYRPLLARRTATGSSSPFRRSSEKRGKSTREPPPVTQQYWTMPNGEQIPIQHGSSAGTPASAAAGQPAAPEAMMSPLQYSQANNLVS